MGHFRDFVAHMRPLGGALNEAQVAHRTDEHIHQPGLAGPVVGAVVGGKPVYEIARKFGFAIHEYVFIRYKDIFENKYGFAPDGPKRGLADIDALHAVPAIVVGLPAENHRDAGRVDRHRADNGVIF